MKFLILTLWATCCLTFSFAQIAADADAPTSGKNRIPVGQGYEYIQVLKKDSIPAGAKKIGSVREINGFREDCDYIQTLEDICLQAYEKRGNAIVITRMKQPGVVATCYRIWADVYNIPEPDKVEKTKKKIAIYDSLIRTVVPEDANYSLIYAYGANTYENNGDFNLYMDNKEVASLSVASLSMNDKNVIKITQPGTVTFGVKIGHYKPMKRLDVEMGKVYFLRCDIYRDGRVGYMTLEQVSPSKAFYDIGFKSFQEMAADK